MRSPSSSRLHRPPGGNDTRPARYTSTALQPTFLVGPQRKTGWVRAAQQLSSSEGLAPSVPPLRPSSNLLSLFLKDFFSYRMVGVCVSEAVLLCPRLCLQGPHTMECLPWNFLRLSGMLGTHVGLSGVPEGSSKLAGDLCGPGFLEGRLASYRIGKIGPPE